MQIQFTYVAPPDRCGYLPDQNWQLRYEVVGQLTPSEYAVRLRSGWRRFGFSLFKPECPDCQQCQSLRVNVAEFRPNQSQRRVRKRNEGEVRVEVGPPSVSDEKLALYDKYHRFQAVAKGWPEHGRETAAGYMEAFVANPFITQEWAYYLGDRLIGVGYVDRLPIGLSAIYFFYDPDERDRSLGTWNILSIIAGARADGLPHVYLGYFVAGCRSLAYKQKFRPNEILRHGAWVPFIG